MTGLGTLRSRGAEPELVRLFEAERKQQIEANGPDQFYPSAILYLAQALWPIHPEPRLPQAAIEVLSSAHDWVFRHEAVQALDGIGEPAAVQALIHAIDDLEPLVRHGGARHLLKLHGLTAALTDPHAVTIRVMSKDAARRNAARRDILAAIAEPQAKER